MDSVIDELSRIEKAMKAVIPRPRPTFTGHHRQNGTLVKQPGSTEWRMAEAARLIAFARGSALPQGGFGWLDANGVVDPPQPRALCNDARMTHVFALRTYSACPTHCG